MYIRLKTTNESCFSCGNTTHDNSMRLSPAELPSIWNEVAQVIWKVDFVPAFKKQSSLTYLWGNWIFHNTFLRESSKKSFIKQEKQNAYVPFWKCCKSWWWYFSFGHQINLMHTHWNRKRLTKEIDYWMSKSICVMGLVEKWRIFSVSAVQQWHFQWDIYVYHS